MVLFYVLLSRYLPFDELDLTALYRKAQAIIISTIFHDYYTMLCYKLQHFFIFIFYESISQMFFIFIDFH
jgi:hypothetical protein